jgi:hypothetical protein
MLRVLPDAASLAELSNGARFLWSLPRFLRRPVRPDEARATLRRRLERREADFLALVRRAVFGESQIRQGQIGQGQSPYLGLLLQAACEYGDLERLVNQDGLESALAALYRAGVYLTTDELKGRCPAVRGSTTVLVDPAQLRNPGSRLHLTGQTSGSRGRRTAVPLDLAVVRAWAVNRCLALAARGGLGWRQAAWYVPGGDALAWLLVYAAFGATPVRWFSPVDPATPGLHPRYRASALALRWGSRLAGVSMPSPEHAPVDNPLPVARWMAELLAGGGTPHLVAYASPAVRLCQAAEEAGLDLQGAQLTLVGEPLTPARKDAVERVGAQAFPTYGSIDGGPFGIGCLRPEAPDEVHLYSDLVTFIQPPSEPAEGEPGARGLFVSSLRPEAPLVLLNVSLGDQAVMTRRHCGCPLEALGWTTHLHTIRSFEKLTAGGMTFLDTDVIRVLEEILPSRFGGGPTDYQLLEEESHDGRAQVRLLVHPRLGPVDAAAIAETFLAAIGPGDAAERIMALQWRGAGLFQVERQPPLASASGKILHLHQARPATSVGATVGAETRA